MGEQPLTELAQKLVQNEDVGFQQFRKLFFETLDRRQLDRCQMLLKILCSASSSRLHIECLYHRSILLSEQRKFDQAEVLLRQLLADDLFPEQHSRILLELAIQLDEQGQWLEAEDMYQRALTVYKANGDKLGQAKTYNNLGISICFQVERGESASHRLQEAISCHQAALALAKAVDEDWEVAKNWHGLGKAYSLLGQYSDALAAFQKYLSLSQAQENLHVRGYTLVDMAALVYLPQGQWTEAATALDEAITILHDFEDDLNLAEALTHQGNLLVQRNNLVEALNSYDRALNLAESIRTRLTAPIAQASYRATVDFIYTAPLSLHLHQGQAARAFSASERARSRVLADLLAGQAAQPRAEISSHLLKQRTVLHQVLDQAYTGDEPPINLPDLEQELASLDRKIELLDAAYAGLESIASLSAEEVQDYLSSDAALLAYVTDADDKLWLLVLTTTEVRAEPIPRVSGRWLQDYLVKRLDGSRPGSLVPDPQTGYLSSSDLFSDLYQALLGPVWDTLQTVRTVYIIPFGPLHYLPLGALTSDQTSPPPLLAEGRRVVYAPSATILFNYCHKFPLSPHQGVLAVAPHDARLQFIHGAVETVAQHGIGTSLIGPTATRQALFAEAGRYRVICFLGHAFFDQRYPMLSSLQLADGNLHASELLRELRMQADLVILAACETGRSHVLRGDEILGLSRAMLYAGTPSLMVTLWPVHEIPTRLLVEKFVKQLPLATSAETHSSPSFVSGHGFDPASALAVAQCWLRRLSYAEVQAILARWDDLPSAEIKKHLTILWQMTHPKETPQAESRLFGHPFFWSPYILIGDRS